MKLIIGCTKLKTKLKAYFEEKLAAMRKWWLYVGTFLKWLVVGSLIGVTGGIVGTVFHYYIEEATNTREENPYLLFFLPVAGLLIVGFYKLTRTEGLNTNNVIRAVHKGRRLSPMLMPAIFLGTVFTQLCGGSAGREGAALQMGGTLGQWIARGLHMDDGDVRIATLAGMAAFFSALFGTPLAAAVFAVMVISIGVLYHVALVPSLVASLTAYFLSIKLGVTPVRFAITAPDVNVTTCFQVAVIGILCAVVSILFCDVIHGAEKYMKKAMPNAWARVFIGGLMIIAMTYIVSSRDYNGVGMDIIKTAVEEGQAEPLAFLLKLLFTAVTLAAGFKGGEIVPSFFVGATFGCVVAPLIGLDPGFGAAVGLVCVFCGVTNCPISSIFLSIEIFGSGGVVLFAVACTLCHMMSGYKGIYSSQMIMYSKRRAKFINTYTNSK